MAAFVLCDQRLCYAMYTVMVFAPLAVQQRKSYAVLYHTNVVLNTDRLITPREVTYTLQTPT